jgi:murein L,D-transpeptidase YcbB/YkuD
MKAMKTLVRPTLLAFALTSPTLPATVHAQSSQPITQPEAPASPAVSHWARPAAAELVSYLDRLDAEGLSPALYSPERLRAALSAGDQAAFTRVADDVFLRLARDLSGGSVRGADRVSWYMAPSGIDEAEQRRLLDQAKRAGVARILDGLLPAHPQYVGLKRALANPANAERRDLIRANMERWRWMPRNLGERHIIVNVPAFTAAFVENGEVIARHRTVVGATSTPTPQLSATAVAVTFNPWWTVPQSIVRTMRGFNGYQVREANGYRIVRQPPGPANSLGRVKIEMPNEHAIYLHDTPSQHLFGRSVRAFSHGCIRTQGIRDFAARLLESTGEWDRGRIDEAIATGRTTQARLAAPMPVYISYFTAAATNDGNIVTYTDVYGRDTRVRQALNRAPSDRAMASGT